MKELLKNKVAVVFLVVVALLAGILLLKNAYEAKQDEQIMAQILLKVEEKEYGEACELSWTLNDMPKDELHREIVDILWRGSMYYNSTQLSSSIEGLRMCGYQKESQREVPEVAEAVRQDFIEYYLEKLYKAGMDDKTIEAIMQIDDLLERASVVRSFEDYGGYP